MADREKVVNGVEHCFHGQECCGDVECPYYIEHLSDSCCLEECQENLKADVLAILKDRTKDYEAWAKEIGADTCVNCRHASFNRNDGKSTCPIEHNFALVKDGYCHLFMRMEGR